MPIGERLAEGWLNLGGRKDLRDIKIVN